MEIKKEDTQKASTVLATSLSHSELDFFLERYLPAQLLPSDSSGIKGTKFHKASLLVEARGSELLADADLRKHLIKGDPGIATILACDPKEDEISLDSIAIKAWHPGKGTAKEFVNTLGLPPIFAGIPSHAKPKTLEEIEPKHKIPPLLPFQEDVVSQVIKILHGSNGHEAMISLPTGAGKTRVAMEAIIKFQKSIKEGIIIWLATTGEICEQACQTYLELLNAYPPSQTYQLHRYWGSHELNYKFERGLLVASVQKMRSQTEFESIPYFMLKRLKAIFFDEGHHAIAPTYAETLQYLEQAGENEKIPIIGLTATPGRGSDPTSEASHRLAKRFGRRLIIPKGKEWENPVEHLQKEGILSRVDPITIRTNIDYQLTGRTADYWDNFKDFSPKFLENMSRDVKRNAIIIDQIKKHAFDKRGIIFACTVEHAEHLAFILKKAGFKNATVTAETRPEIREMNLNEFKEGKLDYLVNFGILTTGIDLPSINVIILARPVSSQVLYEQMVGRGLRGPKFGGTNKCIILDFEDNIQYHGRPLAYSRFRWLWDLTTNEINEEQVESIDESTKIKEMIAAGESDQLEFKSSLRWDYKAEQANKKLEYTVAKTLSAFMNTNGGSLIIGINDDGKILGLENDFKTLGKKQNKDGFKLHLINNINNYIGKEYHTFLSVKIEEIDNKLICIIDVSPSDKPAFINDDQFFIRTCASSQRLGIREALDYVSSHWGD
ncbi:MAG: DEAD/DEAH box helicase [Candidatus Lokiarchaeota archaeon]|nr:DEAD/DEAH box helicase [Candidatus Lokiarchaeota archaeon]